MKLKTLFVAGDFNDDGGRPSSVAKQIHKGLNLGKVDFLNGGKFTKLEEILNIINEYGAVIWMANVPNNKPKIVESIKKANPFCVLVTSKRNEKGEYSFFDILNRALYLKSNLIIEVSSNNEKYIARVLDPLGNVFCDFSDNFKYIGEVLSKRVTSLQSFTRVGSKSIGDPVEIPDESEFFELVKSYADKFHEIIHTSNSERLLGNASFRCERGFPSFKDQGAIYVSRRNIDKRYIGNEGFVAVNNGSKLGYFGDIKPSVDSPIQVRLYEYYKNIKYIIHSHVYVKNAVFTDSVVPCGALEEVDEIISKIEDTDINRFSINLRGHGSLVASDNVDYLKDIEYISRDMPEKQF